MPSLFSCVKSNQFVIIKVWGSGFDSVSYSSVQHELRPRISAVHLAVSSMLNYDLSVEGR